MTPLYMAYGKSKSFRRFHRTEIFFIDFVRWNDIDQEPDIMSRVIHHARNSTAAKEDAKLFVAGVRFPGVQAVRLSDRMGQEISCWKLDGEPLTRRLPLAKRMPPAIRLLQRLLERC